MLRSSSARLKILMANRESRYGGKSEQCSGRLVRESAYHAGMVVGQEAGHDGELRIQFRVDGSAVGLKFDSRNDSILLVQTSSSFVQILRAPYLCHDLRTHVMCGVL